MWSAWIEKLKKKIVYSCLESEENDEINTVNEDFSIKKNYYLRCLEELGIDPKDVDMKRLISELAIESVCVCYFNGKVYGKKRLRDTLKLWDGNIPIN